MVSLDLWPRALLDDAEMQTANYVVTEHTGASTVRV